MSPRTVSLAAALFAQSALAASPLEIELVGGFHAVGHPSIATGEKSQAYTYAVRGGTLLSSQDGRRLRFSIDCTGLDRLDAAGATTGSGHCVWSDADGDRLFVSIATASGGNAYTVTGGSGKWTGATGSLQTAFSYLPSPDPQLFLGVEEGRGTLNISVAGAAR